MASIKSICAFIVSNWVFTDYMKNMIGHLFMVKKHSENALENRFDRSRSVESIKVKVK